LGGRTNLRGFRKTRFAGRSAAYTNAELRAKLADFNVYITRGELGAFGFYDLGRVWADGEDSDLWHQGYGGGIWITPFYRFVVTGALGFSEEGRLVDLSFGLFF
jgi:hemolysin activation/secretion protein